MVKFSKKPSISVAIVCFALAFFFVGRWFLGRGMLQPMVCIGAFGCTEAKGIEALLNAKGIPLSSDGICDVGMSSMMIPKSFETRAILAIRKLQASHPEMYLGLSQDVGICDIFKPNQQLAIDALKTAGVPIRAIHVERDLVWLSIPREDKAKAVAVLQDFHGRHPEIRMEVFPGAQL